MAPGSLSLRRRSGLKDTSGDSAAVDGRGTSTSATTTTSSPLSTSTKTTTAEPLHHESAAVLHTTDLGDAALALRGLGPLKVPERENTAVEEGLAVATMALLFGFVFLGPWATLAALLHVSRFLLSPSSGDSTGSQLLLFRLSCAFLSLVAAASLLPVYPRGAFPRFRDSTVWDCWRRYFKIKVVTPPLPFLEKGRAYVFAHFPHGCFPVGSFLSAAGLLACDEVGLPRDTRPAIASALFRLPVLRQIYTWCNCVPCDWKTLSGYLESGVSVGVIPEGVAGIFVSRPTSPSSPSSSAPEERIFTGHRGFVKLALRTGSPIVPVYALGQSRVLTFRGLRSLSRRLRVSLGVWWGRWGLPCLPRKEEIVLVVCPPVEVSDVVDGDGATPPEITQRQIDRVFDRVASALKKAHDETKGGVKGWENSEMVFCG